MYIYIHKQTHENIYFYEYNVGKIMTLNFAFAFLLHETILHNNNNNYKYTGLIKSYTSIGTPLSLNKLYITHNTRAQ